MSDDVITKEDEHRHATVADLKRQRKQLNNIIGDFQKDLVTGQVRSNLVWNGVNSVLRALLDKGLITPKDVEEAGKVLMREAQENMRTAQKAVEEGRRPTMAELIKSPIEQFLADLNRKKNSDGDS